MTRNPSRDVLQKEPAGAIGTAITTILAGIWLVLKASGVEVAEDLPTAIDALISGLLMVPAITGWLTRFFVYSPRTHHREVERARLVDPNSNNPDDWPDPPMPEPIQNKFRIGRT